MWVLMPPFLCSYSMRHFVAAGVAHLKAQKGADGVSVFASQLLTVLCIHSDNAAQYFKSSKSLHWLSDQVRGMGFTSVLWDFGPPGHGKALFLFFFRLFFGTAIARITPCDLILIAYIYLN